MSLTPNRLAVSALMGTIALIAAVTEIPAHAATAATAATGHASSGSNQASAVTSSVPPALSADADIAVSGAGDPNGYHVFAAAKGSGGWQPLATLAPHASTEGTYVGRECVTGDGSTAVVVVAPWQAVNTPAGNDRGATAYAIDLTSRHVRVLADDVATYYFNPGCGSGHDVALTRYLGTNEQTTQLLDLDATTGHVLENETTAGELTSAVPIAGGIAAARGEQVVRVVAGRIGPLNSLAAAPYDLRPNAEGGVDLLTDDATGAHAWRLDADGMHPLGAGTVGSVGLYSARAGHTVLTGVSHAQAAAGLTANEISGHAVLGVSLDGDLSLVAPTGAAASGALPGLLDSRGHLVAQSQRPTARDAGPVITASVPVDPRAALSRTAVRNKSASTTPACAVPRLNVQFQVPQPTNAQVNWAAYEAAQNALPGRPAGWDNLPGGGYSPEADFPQPALAGGSGQHVPGLLVDAIMAQESNFDQASPHAPPGIPGDPLIADYYGAAGSLSTIDYSKADCGYGLGQITSLMFAGKADQNVQNRVAVDYAENAAATVYTLAQKWNQLHAAGINVNDGNPSYLENWYDAAWAYNSGVQPTDPALGNTTGCTPGPNCTDPAGQWGLGWANNPINPVYPPNREAFLTGPNGYADASKPSDWPYQERIFGWMSYPLGRYDAGAVKPAYFATSTPVTPAPHAAFCNVSDDCDPSATNSPCSLTGSEQDHCWFHESIALPGGCALCHTDPNHVSPGTQEPPAPAYTNSVCTIDTTQLPSSTPAGHTLIVTDEAPSGTDVNLAGCGPTPQGWSNQGSFNLQYGRDATGAPLGQIDFHQLGGGFGGHMYFSHQVATADTEHRVTATWTPALTTAEIYQIWAFIPDLGATAQASYTVTPNYAGRQFTANVDQNSATGWVDLGQYYLAPGAAVSLANHAASASTADEAFSAMAFQPVARADGWTAMGDSYSSGEGNPGFLIGTDVGSDTCHRSQQAYAYQAQTGTSRYAGKFAMTACSRQTTQAITGSGTSTEGPQIAALSDQTKLVTLTIGGNDVNFAGILADCVTRVVPGSCGADFPDLANQIQAMRTTLADTYGAIHANAPNARIVVLTYPEIFDPKTPDPSTCWVAADSVSWINQNWTAFNTVIKQAASDIANTGVQISVVDETQAFAGGHQLCDSPDPWVNGVVLTHQEYSFHPNAEGHGQEAADLKKYLLSIGALS